VVDNGFNFNTDVNHCGRCDNICHFEHGTARCDQGTCQLASCDPGWVDCEGNGTCETQLGTVNNCGFCGDVCGAPNSTASCEGGTCDYTCDVGWADCDADMRNGCETELGTAENCGFCGDTCTPGQTCASGSCGP
jgi:hypothetical protein